MICKPSGTAAGADVFAFGSQDPTLQAMRNLTVLMALPWAAAWAVSAELAAESLRRAGF
jgi:hypothetical protein